MKNNLDLAKYLLKIAKKAYKFAKKQKYEVQDKNVRDLVTTYDFTIEKFLIKELQKTYPNVKIVSEEYNSSVLGKGTYFTIDPIDGTINFANNLPDFAVQIAYVENDEILSSVIYMPKFKADYIAGKGCGAYKNGRKLIVEPKPLDHSLIELIYPRDNKSITTNIEKIRSLAIDVRRYGASCRIYTYLVENVLGARIEYGKYNVWDNYPGILLANEAGCVTAEQNNYLITASSEQNLNAILSIINKK